jgi:hypothetical protein
MIWRKSWLECRFRIILALFMSLSMLAGIWTMYSEVPGPRSRALPWVFVLKLLGGFVVPVVAVLMAGSGINSQTSMGMRMGFHPAMYFLLSLPVSRRRALLVRTACAAIVTVGFVVLTVPGAGWIVGHYQADVFTDELLAATVFTSVAALGLLGVATFLTTYFDEFWSGVIGLAVAGGQMGFGIAVDRARIAPLTWMAGVQYHRTGQLGWQLTAFYLLVGAAFLAASVWMVERKEY